MIAIIDYGVGNLFSLKSSLKQLGLEAVVTADADTIRKADRLILPGVGAFADAMDKLEATGLVPVIKEEAERKPLLGICLGMQLLLKRATSTVSTKPRLCEGRGLPAGARPCGQEPEGAADRLERLAHCKGRPAVPVHP